MAYARITLLPSHQVLHAAAGETLLDAALRAGLNLPHSCKGGHCSSCRARLHVGEVSYPQGRPAGLMAEEERAGEVLLCQAHAASTDITLEVRDIPPPAPEIIVKSLPCRIERLIPLTANIMAVFLRLPASEPFHFSAGQYLDILLPQNRRRSFSIASTPQEALIELHIRRVASGEFTQQLFQDMQPGTLLRIEGPLGQFWFRHESPRPALMIGGGTGYAPLRSMLHSLLRRDDRRRLHLYWGAQQAADLYEDEHLHALMREHPNLSYTAVVSHPQAQPDWHGRRGWVHEAALADHPDLANWDVYASGPPAMVDAMRQHFLQHHLPLDQLFFDSFDFAPDAQAAIAARARQQQP